MRERIHTDRPRPWREERESITTAWAVPFHRLNWMLAWASWALSNWALLDVLEHLGTFSVLVAVVFYFADSGNRLKQKHYQAWQVINTAQGKGGSGGRIDALQELNDDRVSLIGVDASTAYLRGVRLENAHLDRCNLESADLRNGNLRFARLNNSDLISANLREADLTGADLDSADIEDADLNQAVLVKANLVRADLDRDDLRYADLQGAAWQQIRSLKLANIYGIRNAPPEFLVFAQKQGAVSLSDDNAWNALLRNSTPDDEPNTK
jgi:hypothetical protein